VRVPAEYHADFLDTVLVRSAMSKSVVSLLANQTLGQVRAWVHSRAEGTSHQGFPVLDPQTHLVVGVLTRRQLLDDELSPEVAVGSLIRMPAKVIYDDLTLRDAADHMVNHDIGRLPVVSRSRPGQVIGMITRSDLLRAHRRRIADEESRVRLLGWRSNGQDTAGKPVSQSSHT
jgi:CBS domain-containing protein